MRDVRLRHCEASHILIHSVGYNDDGEGSDVPPVFENMEFHNVTYATTSDRKTSEENHMRVRLHHARNVTFDDIEA